MTDDEPPAELPPHDPLVCGLHTFGTDGAEDKVYCPRCKIDGEWKADRPVPGKVGPTGREQKK